MYFSAASRITQATDTFFCFAISCSVAYNSGGKLAEARVARGLPVGFRPRLAVMIAPLIKCSILQQCAARGKRGAPELMVMGDRAAHYGAVARGTPAVQTPCLPDSDKLR